MEYNAGLLATCMAVLLGFADDVTDLKWRHKLIVPTIASVPLVVAYNGLTSVVVPRPFRFMLGMSVDLGLLYQVYMSMLAVFCTNSINIYAGINGIEVGQSFIIGVFVFIHNIIVSYIYSNLLQEIHLGLSEQIVSNHIFSLTIIIPFLSVTLALMKYNRFPSKVFVGDTFCYFAGMTFAMVSILGHFSKTILLFFAPQIFGFIHCPRHRLPRFNDKTYKLECVHNHFTNINAFLRVFGSTNE